MLYVYCNISAGDDDECMGWPREIFALTSLRRLNLSFHGFRQLPPHVQQLKALEELVISNNPLLESLPGELALLPHLRGLLVRMISCLCLYFSVMIKMAKKDCGCISGVISAGDLGDLKAVKRVQ